MAISLERPPSIISPRCIEVTEPSQDTMNGSPMKILTGQAGMRSDGRSSKTANIKNVEVARIRLSGTPTLIQDQARTRNNDSKEPARRFDCFKIQFHRARSATFATKSGDKRT